MEPSAEIEGTIRSWFESVARGDASWLDRHLSPDSRLRIIGTDPGEWLQGSQARALLESDLAALGGAATFDIKEIEGFSEGDVGWGCAAITVNLPGGASISPRWSGVFHREGGEWKAVHVHASAGVTNEQLFGATFSS